MAFVETQGSKKGRPLVLVSAIVLAFIFLLAVLAYSGAIKINTGGIFHNQTAKQRFMSDSLLSNQSQSVQIKYVVAGQDSVYGYPQSSPTKVNLTEYVLNNASSKSSKILLDLGNMGAEGIYTNNGQPISCTETASSQTYYSGGLSCSILYSSTQILLTDLDLNATTILNKSMIAYNGTATVAGDSCDEFLITISAQNISSLEQENVMMPSLSGSQPLYISYCISSSSGLQDSMYVYTSSYNKLLAKNVTTYLLNITAVSISHPRLNYSTFQPPIKIDMNYAICYPHNLSATFTPLISTANITFRVLNLTSTSGAKINITKQANITIEKSINESPFEWLPYNGVLEAGKTYTGTINLEHSISLPTGAYQYPTICISGSCFIEPCYVYQPYNYIPIATVGIVTENNGPTAVGNNTYPTSLNFTPGTWSGTFDYSDANQTDPNQTFVPDGKYGTMTIYDANQSGIQQAAWQWNFPYAINGTFHMVWKASVTPCQGYSASTNATLFVNGMTPNQAGGYSSTAGPGMPQDIHLNNTVTSIGPINSTFSGDYSNIALYAGTLFDKQSTACPLNVSVDGVWVTKG